MQQIYTLEKHLENICRENTDFEILNSVWKLNKNNLPKALATISANFPHYSLHDASHSNTILKNIESFLGEERIRSLSPTDTWLLLMASYTHDLGMVVFYNVLSQNWLSEEFQKYLKEISNNSSDKALVNAAKRITDIKEYIKSDKYDDKNEIEEIWPLEIRNDVTLLTADFYRRTHQQRSKDMLQGHEEEFFEVSDNFYINQLPKRFSDVLAEIAYAHGIDFYEVLERLEFIANGYGTDKMHPRFIAYMLRLGDLLDVDDKRFSIYDEKVLGKLPHTSEVHKAKHAAVKHLLICPDSIEVTLDCKTDEVYRAARQWFDWLIDEVDKQSKEWSLIAPKNLTGLPPVIINDKIKILYKSAHPKKELMNLRFAISNQKVFEIFEGGAIYENPGFVFLRELVQNALDASKIQLWKDIQRGVYNFTLKPHLIVNYALEDAEVNDENIVKLIRFPNDIPDQIWRNYEIILKIDWGDNNDSLSIEIQDKGTGISELDLIRMTHKVGESRKRDKDFKKFETSIPFWLKPTGAFGIGLQSIFLVSDEFIIQTKAENEEAKEVIFRSAKMNNYSSITDNKPQGQKRGTTVKVSIQRDRLPALFGETFPTDVLINYDYFSASSKDNIHLHLIAHYLKKELGKVESLKVTIEKDIIKQSFSEHTNIINESEKPLTKITEDFSFKCQIDANNKDLTFKIFESAIVGSELKVAFYRDYDFLLKSSNSIAYSNPVFKEPKDLKHDVFYFVRDIPTSEKYPWFYKLYYLAMRWNLLSPESDKILNISRDKLIKKKRRELDNKLLKEILPKSLILIFQFIHSYKNKLIDKYGDLATVYFNLHLSCIINGYIPETLDNSIYGDNEIPKEIIAYKDRSRPPIKYKDFFYINSFLVINTRKAYSGKKKSFEEIVVSIEDRSDAEALVKVQYFLNEYLKETFVLNEIYLHSQDEGYAYLMVKKNNSDYLIPKCDDSVRKDVIKSIAPKSHGFDRKLIYPLAPYAEVIGIKNKFFDGFEIFPYLSNHSIISPFKSKDDVVVVVFGIRNIIEEDPSINIVSFIKENYIDKLISKRLIEAILDSASMANKNELTEEKIKHTYCELIKEYYEIIAEDD